MDERGSLVEIVKTPYVDNVETNPPFLSESVVVDASPDTVAVFDPVPPPLLNESSENLGRGLRDKRQSVRFQDYVTYNATWKDNAHHAPIASPVESSSLVQGTSRYPINAGIKPSIYKQAVKDKVWRGALSFEYDALEELLVLLIYLLAKKLLVISGCTRLNIMLMGL